jgi:hypothetical protein
MNVSLMNSSLDTYNGNLIVGLNGLVAYLMETPNLFQHLY